MISIKSSGWGVLSRVAGMGYIWYQEQKSIYVDRIAVQYQP